MCILYVGPFLECDPGDFDWGLWGDLLTDRREIPSKPLILTPLHNLPGVASRVMDWGIPEEADVRYGFDVGGEMVAFKQYAAEPIQSLNEANALYAVLWGVVPCWEATRGDGVT